MTTNNNTATWALVILVGLLALLAFRSIFFVLPFGFFPGAAHVFREAGHSIGSVFGFFPIVLLPLALLALWIFVCVWVYRDAQERGMNGLLWALLVLIGHVIGLIIYLIVRSERAARPQAQAACCEKCPSCGTEVRAGYTFCPHCGKPMKLVCPSCKRPVESGWKVCPHCGASLDAGKVEQA
jgi:uncharacterized membrane protein YhaH (DUF805 family)